MLRELAAHVVHPARGLAAKAAAILRQHVDEFSIYEVVGKTILATLKPTTMLAMFNTPQLAGVAQEVQDTIVKIMKEAAAGI